MSKSKKKSPPKRRNPIAVIMNLRFGKTTTVMHDRRQPRGGAKNEQSSYRSEDY
jgi:hypothetical protein